MKGIVKRFKFGNTEHPCEEVLHVHMPVNNNTVITFDAFVVPIDFSRLLGLDALRDLKFSIDIDDGTLINDVNGQKVK